MPFIQYVGIDNVLQAFKAQAIPFWSLAPGKERGEIFCSNSEIDEMEESAELLEQALSRIHQDPKNIFKLKVYKEVPGSGIKDKTEPDSTLYFTLCADPKQSPEYLEYRETDKLRRQNNWDALFSRISAIEEKLQEQDNEEEEEIQETENSGLSGIVNNLISRPEVQTALISWVGGMLTKKPAIAGIDNNDSSIQTSLDILKSVDPQLENDLKLLADMAKKDPAQFNFLLTLLRK